MFCVQCNFRTQIYVQIILSVHRRSSEAIKMVISEGDHSDELVSLFHPSQLEQKFGGTAEDLTVFWPPKEASTEYGDDPRMFTIEGEENTEIHDELPPSKLISNSRSNDYKLWPNLNPSDQKQQKLLKVNTRNHYNMVENENTEAKVARIKKSSKTLKDNQKSKSKANACCCIF